MLVLRVIAKPHSVAVVWSSSGQFSTAVANCQQVSVRSSTRILDRQISLRYCQSSPQTTTPKQVSATDDQQQSEAGRPLVVMLTWLAAQEKHIEKYRGLYLRRGFDVLTVKTSPYDLLFPVNGARKIANKCVDALQKQLDDYPSVLIHAFSVGGYQFGEMLLKMRQEQEEEASRRQQDQQQRRLQQRIAGVIFDSVVTLEGVSNGVARSITANPFLYKLLKSVISTHLVVCRSIATKYYEASSDAVWSNYLRVPALVMVSEDDQIATAASMRRLTDVWKGLGIEVGLKCWQKSGHVQHLPTHPVEYQDTVDQFLRKVNLVGH